MIFCIYKSALTEAIAIEKFKYIGVSLDHGSIHTTTCSTSWACMHSNHAAKFLHGLQRRRKTSTSRLQTISPRS